MQQIHRRTFDTINRITRMTLIFAIRFVSHLLFHLKLRSPLSLFSFMQDEKWRIFFQQKPYISISISIVHFCYNLAISVQPTKLTSLRCIFEEFGESVVDFPAVDIMVLHGAANICLPSGTLTVKQYADFIFLSYLNSLRKDILPVVVHTYTLTSDDGLEKVKREESGDV